MFYYYSIILMLWSFYHVSGRRSRCFFWVARFFNKSIFKKRQNITKIKINWNFCHSWICSSGLAKSKRNLNTNEFHLMHDGRSNGKTSQSVQSVVVEAIFKLELCPNKTSLQYQPSLSSISIHHVEYEDINHLDLFSSWITFL